MGKHNKKPEWWFDAINLRKKNQDWTYDQLARVLGRPRRSVVYVFQQDWVKEAMNSDVAVISDLTAKAMHLTELAQDSMDRAMEYEKIKLSSVIHKARKTVLDGFDDPEVPMHIKMKIASDFLGTMAQVGAKKNALPPTQNNLTINLPPGVSDALSAIKQASQATRLITNVEVDVAEEGEAENDGN